MSVLSSLHARVRAPQSRSGAELSYAGLSVDGREEKGIREERGHVRKPREIPREGSQIWCMEGHGAGDLGDG